MVRRENEKEREKDDEYALGIALAHDVVGCARRRVGERSNLPRALDECPRARCSAFTRVRTVAAQSHTRDRQTRATDAEALIEGWRHDSHRDTTRHRQRQRKRQTRRSTSRDSHGDGYGDRDYGPDRHTSHRRRRTSHRDAATHTPSSSRSSMTLMRNLLNDCRCRGAASVLAAAAAGSSCSSCRASKWSVRPRAFQSARVPCTICAYQYIMRE